MVDESSQSITFTTGIAAATENGPTRPKKVHINNNRRNIEPSKRFVKGKHPVEKPELGSSIM